MNPTELTKLLLEFRDRGAEKHFFPCNPKRTDIQMAKKYYKEGHDALAPHLVKAITALEKIGRPKPLDFDIQTMMADTAREALAELREALEVKK